LFTETKNTPKKIKKSITTTAQHPQIRKEKKNWDFLLICRPTSSSLLCLCLPLSLSFLICRTAKYLHAQKKTELPSYFLVATYCVFFFFLFSKHLQYGRMA